MIGFFLLEACFDKCTCGLHFFLRGTLDSIDGLSGMLHSGVSVQAVNYIRWV